jgi:hypothetical protein
MAGLIDSAFAAPQPVSTSAVATMVSDPPSSMLRAAPKKRFGRWSALLSTPPHSTLPDGGTISRGSRIPHHRSRGLHALRPGRRRSC